MKEIKVPIRCQNPELLPTFGSLEAAGADLRAAIDQPVILMPLMRILIPTGIRLELPKGYEWQIRPRSGLALKHGITIINTPGTIDSDYRGEVGVILINLSNEAFTIEPKMRIAQAVLQPVFRAQFVQENSLSESVRGEGGFGHTGSY
ncbi:MAG: dUTP diphosphatase [Simkaniaceae bacterium]